MRNALDPRVVVDSSSASVMGCVGARRERAAAAATANSAHRADHEAAAALCLKLGLRSCKELREAKWVQ
jgi:hypothetical protein